jgi:hypothetical protein
MAIRKSESDRKLMVARSRDLSEAFEVSVPFCLTKIKLATIVHRIGWILYPA